MDALHCSDIMKTNLRTIAPTDEVRLAIAEMKHDEVRHLLVVDSTNALVGMLSDRDLARASTADAPVKSIMSVVRKTVTPATLAAIAAEMMLDNKVDALPVLDDDRLVGIITRTDFVDIAYRVLVGLDPFAPRARA